jgi:hypothetical protein
VSPAKDRPRRGGKGVKAPASVTADRVDTVLKGQWVHLDPPTLDATPGDGWLEVASVEVTDGLVTLGFTGAVEPAVLPVDRLVGLGWA